ncbi:hypothetical protein GCM10007162_11500 [Ignatzschineria ureiclastica]|nr:hypothetical protein GCM10007162_11500 [Ignatzschineria ureiclastica]
MGRIDRWGAEYKKGVQNKHYFNAGASADQGKEAVLSGILQALFRTVLSSF